MFIWPIVIFDVGFDYEYCYQIAKTGQHTKHLSLHSKNKKELEFILKFINNQLMHVN